MMEKQKEQPFRVAILKCSSVDKVLLPRGKFTRIVITFVLTVQRYKLIMKVPNFWGIICILAGQFPAITIFLTSGKRSSFLPFGLSLSQLSKEHSSIPTNPILANPVYLAGYIERLGTGTTDIIEQCEAMGLPTPQFIQDAFFKVVIYRKLKALEGNNDNFEQSNNDIRLINADIKEIGESIDTGNNIEQSNKESNIDGNIDVLSYQQQVVVNFCYVPRTSTEILKRIGLTRQTKNIKTYITDLVEKGFLKMIDSEHPRSKNQKYIKV